MHRGLLLAWTFILLLSPVIPLTAQQGSGQANPPTILYDGQSGTMLSDQGFSLLALGPGASQRFDDGLTVLDTTANAGDQAGYIARELLNLDRSQGYALLFSIHLLEEIHHSPHRAGFSVIMLGDDLLGVELAFWENEIWVQEGGSGAALFRRAESVAFDTTAGLEQFELRIQGDGYTLAVGDTLLLSGPLRDYTAFEGFPDPYETPGFLFFGDNTRRAAAKTAIAFVALDEDLLAAESPRVSGTAPLDTKKSAGWYPALLKRKFLPK